MKKIIKTFVVIILGFVIGVCGHFGFVHVKKHGTTTSVAIVAEV